MEDLSNNRRRDDFIDIVRREINGRPGTVADLAKDDLLHVVNDMQYVSAGRRRRFREGITNIVRTRSFEPTVQAARYLIASWRSRADELETVFHYIIDSVSNTNIQVSSESLPARTKKAREQLQASLREASEQASHRITELRLSIELCVKQLGYDATFIEASRLTNDLRSDANDLENALCDIMFDDLCSRMGAHGQSSIRRVA